MRIISFLLLIGISINLFSQQCNDCRYVSEIFDSVDIDEDIKFGEGLDYNDNLQELYLDVYFPHGDTVTNRPVMIFAFGGSFLFGNRKENYIKNICRFYAKTGYVAVAVDYRYGLKFSDVNNELKVMFRAMQDMRASVQYFKQSVTNGNPYNIDSNMIFIGGGSAGAMSSIYAIYCDTPEKAAMMGDTTVLAQYGGFWATSTIYPGHSWNVAGVLNFAGAIFSTDWIEAGDVPLLSVHGDADSTVSYAEQDSGSLFDLYDFTTEGSYLIDQHANQIGACSYLYTIEGGGHPTTGENEYFYDNAFNRWMPRMHAIINGRSICCNLNLDISGNTAVGGSGSSSNFEAVISNAPSTTTTQWCGAPCNFTSNQNDITVTPNTGQYYIAYAYDNTCQATDFIEITNYTSIAEYSGVEIKLYPNPANNQLIINASNTDYKRLKVKLFDVNGKLWLTKTINGQASLIVNELPTGIYIAEIQLTDDLIWRKQVVISR